MSETAQLETAQYSGKHCVLAYPDGVRISALYDTQPEAERARYRLKLDYPKATTAYWPTKAEVAAQRLEMAEADKWCVTSYRVVTDTERGGITIKGYPISAAYATRNQAAARLAELQRFDSSAWIREEVEHCRDMAHYHAAVSHIVQP